MKTAVGKWVVIETHDNQFFADESDVKSTIIGNIVSISDDIAGAYGLEVGLTVYIRNGYNIGGSGNLVACEIHDVISVEENDNQEAPELEHF